MPSLPFETLEDTKSGKKENGERVFEGREKAIVGVESVLVAEVEEVLVVEESALPGYLGVGGVYLGNHHVHQHSRQDHSEATKTKNGCPVVVHLIEDHSPNCCLNQWLGAHINSMAAFVLLEKNGEGVACDEEENRSTAHPDHKTLSIELNHLGERPEDSSNFETKEEPEDGENCDKPIEIRSCDVTSPIVQEKGIGTLGGEVKLLSLAFEFAIELEDKPQCQGRNNVLEEVDFSAEEASEGSADCPVEEGIKKVSKREEVVEHHNPERVFITKSMYFMTKADILTCILHSLVESLGSPLRTVKLKSSDCVSTCIKGILSLRKARVGYSSVQRSGVNVSIVEKLGEKDSSSEESLE